MWEDKVLTSSSKYSTMWLNVIMSGMWVLVIVLVLWLVAGYPSGMNAINLSFVIYSTFNHKDEVRAHSAHPCASIPASISTSAVTRLRRALSAHTLNTPCSMDLQMQRQWLISFLWYLNASIVLRCASTVRQHLEPSLIGVSSPSTSSPLIKLPS